MASAISLKVIIFGFNPNGLSKMEGYEDRGLMFWIIGTLFCAVIFSAPFYLLSRPILKKWNPKVYMILISVFVGLLLIFSL
jgi:hypothetical protein